MKYAIIDNHTGFVWGQTTAATPIDACQAIDLDISPGILRRYSEISISEASSPHYIVYETPAGWHCDDGQDQAQIDECLRFPLRAYVGYQAEDA